MKNIILATLCFCIISCGPESIPGGCYLDALDGAPYEGFVRLCNGIPGQQQDFPAETFWEVKDTILSFQIHSIDPNTSFEYNTSVITECVKAEDEFIHLLHDSLSSEIIGSIGLKGTSLFIKLVTNPCPENGTFSGVIK